MTATGERTRSGAKGLSSRLGVPHYDLDAVAFVDDAWAPRPALERDRLVSDILAKPAFVTDGFFLGGTTPFFVAADHIVWLDPSSSAISLPPHPPPRTVPSPLAHSSLAFPTTQLLAPRWTQPRH
jgi:hypothetical protein